MLERLLPAGRESRAITYQSLFESGGYLPGTTRAGVNISQESSLKIGAVYAAVRLISDTISTLPMDTFFRADGQRLPYRPRPEWVDNPDPDGKARSSHYQQLLISLLINGSSFTRIIRDGSGDVIALVVLDPHRVEVRRGPSGRVVYVVDQGQYVLQADEVVQIDELLKPGALRGTSRIDEARELLGLSAALQEFSARFFGSGTVMTGFLEVPYEITAEQAEDLKDKFESKHGGLGRSHRPAVLSGGAKWTKTSVDPNEAQMLESREFAVEEVCRIFRVPPHLLQVTKPGAMSYASVEENSRQFVTYTLLPYIAKIEEAYSRLLPGGAFLKFNVDGLLRGDTSSRFAAYSQGLQAGFLTINDVRRLEDMRPVDSEGADVPRVPLANVNIAAADITEMDKKILMAQRLVVVGFDPAETMRALGLPDIAHTGLPSVQLQGIAQVDPEDPATAYPVRSTHRTDPATGAGKETP